MGKKLLLIGGGGHCRSVLDSVLAANAYDGIGIIDPDGSPCLGIPVIGQDEDLPRLFSEGWTDAVITVGSIGDTGTRRRLYETAKAIGFRLPAVVDPTAVIGKDAVLGEGTFVGKRAVVNAGARTGVCVIVNTGAIVEHDCVIGDFAHISTGAILCGQVTVGNDAHIGAGTTVRQSIRIGDGALVGVGSTAVKDIPAGAKAYGNPCRVVEA